MSFKEWLIVSVVLVIAAFSFFSRNDLNEDYNKALVYAESKQYSKAFPLFKELAEDGDVIAQFNTGLFYLNGLGVNQNTKQSMHWFEASANSGLRDAQYNLAKIYSTEGSINYKKSIYWFEKAAEQGDAEAYNNLGTMYNSGLGTDVDMDKALFYFSQGANLGSIEAMNNLALSYMNNEETNNQDVIDWFEKAAKKVHVNDQKSLADIYV